LLLGALLVAFLVLAAQAHAATISVDTTADELNSDGDCSLREAIEGANTNVAVDACAAGEAAPTVDLIDFGVTGTITLGSNLPSISEAVTIDGPGAANLTVSGGGAVRVLEVSGGTTLNLEGVTVANGSAGSPGGGGILNNGTLTITSSTVSGNSTSVNGGGIWSGGTVTLNTSTVNGNSVGGFGGGGGIYVGGGSVTVNKSAVSGNSASSGGGIMNFGTLTLTSSTVSSNTVAASGGGIHNGGGTVTLNSSTISSNMLGSAGGGISFNTGTLTLKNTIVANNQGAQCAVFAGSLTSAGHNMSSDGSCGLTAPGDQPNTDPQLGPLGDNGGPTQTHDLLPGSPAIDAGSGDCPPPVDDQRGISRPQGAGCDIGAFEVRTTYARPKAASPIRVSLVPAYEECTAPNSSRSGGFPGPSCYPPQLISDQLTIGTPELNGKPVQSVGFARMRTLTGIPATPEDEADIAITVSVTDVRREDDLADYTGELLAHTEFRITDKTGGGTGNLATTSVDVPFEFTVPCASTTDTTIGGECSITTTADTLAGGSVAEGKRSIFKVGDIQLFDGGSDGDAGTPTGNTLFAWQGLFVP
jgi:CSLREA domain-containing protein